VTWDQVIELAERLPEAEVVRGDRGFVRLRGTVVARPVASGVLFNVDGDAERDRLIASEPDRYFTTPQYRELSVVIADASRLDIAACRERLTASWHELAPELAIPPRARTRHCYWLALWTDVHTERVRRRFLRFTADSALDWIASGWSADDTDWPPRLSREERFDFSRMFSAVYDDGDPAPHTRDEVLERVREYLDADASAHFVNGSTDDDEGTEIEYFVFDDTFLARPDALDYLPHPDRGAPGDDDEDAYRKLIQRRKG
jgi:hypothetical protein